MEMASNRTYEAITGLRNLNPEEFINNIDISTSEIRQRNEAGTWSYS